MTTQVLSYERSNRSRQRFLWVAGALEIEGGVIMMPAVAWMLGMSVSLLMGPPPSAGAWLAALVMDLLPGAVALGLVLCGLWLRGREPAAPVAGAILVTLVALPFGWMAVAMMFHAQDYGRVFLSAALTVDGAVALFQAILLVGLVYHHLQNQQDRRERLAMRGL